MVGAVIEPDPLEDSGPYDPFGRVPNALVTDTRVDAAALVTYAFRSTFTNFALKVRAKIFAQAVRGGGLGEKKRKKALADLKALGVLERSQQHRRRGRGHGWGPVVETLVCDEAPRHRYFVVRRSIQRSSSAHAEIDPCLRRTALSAPRLLRPRGDRPPLLER